MVTILFSERIRQLREEQNLKQKHLASALDIDTPMYSRIERGDRGAKREQVEIIAQTLKTDKDELINLWLADKVCSIVSNETKATDILNIAAENICKDNE